MQNNFHMIKSIEYIKKAYTFWIRYYLKLFSNKGKYTSTNYTFL